MLKTYLYVPEELNQEIQQLAASQNLSKAEIIRKAIKEGLNFIKGKKTGGADALLRLADLAQKFNVKGPKDLSTNLDKYAW